MRELLAGSVFGLALLVALVASLWSLAVPVMWLVGMVVAFALMGAAFVIVLAGDLDPVEVTR